MKLQQANPFQHSGFWYWTDESAVSRDITKSQGAFAYLVKHKTSSIELKQTLHKAVLSAPL